MSPSTVAVVTDSTAALPEELVAAHHLNVVPLTVTIDSASGREGVDITAEDVAKALTARRSSISTSRPSPAEFVSVYERLLGEGVPGVVSVHLSAKLSGTCQAAQLAAAGYPGRVAVVDSRSTGMGLGFCAIAASGHDDLAAAVVAVEAAGAAQVEVGVHQLAATGRADELVVRLRGRVGDRLLACYETEIG